MAKLLVVDLNKHEVFVKGKRVFLSPSEYRILTELMASRRTMSRQTLLERIWEGDESFDKEKRTIDQHLSRLRKRLKIDVIETVPTFGYKYTGA